MSNISKSCTVAFPTECNHATSNHTDETTPATPAQPTSLKALAEAVFRRNQMRNSCATNAEKQCNLSPQNNHTELHPVETSCIEKPQNTKTRTVSVAREGKTETPISCEGCPALELLDVAGVMVAGCVKTLPPSSPWAEEWLRIPEGLTACPDKPRQSNGHGCGFCGANIYTEAPGGWRGEGCGIPYKSIGGTHAPRLQIH